MHDFICSALITTLYCLNSCFSRTACYGDCSVTSQEFLYATTSCSSYVTSHDLVCTSQSQNSCFFYEGTTDGDFILTTYRQSVAAAISFDAILTVFIFALLIISSIVICCPSCMGETEEIVVAEATMPHAKSINPINQA